MSRALFGIGWGIAGFRRLAAIAFAVALAVAPVLVAVPTSAAMSPGASSHVQDGHVTAAAAANAAAKCNPDTSSVKDDNDDDSNDNDDNNNDDNDDNQCPPPIVPETPTAILLPLSAGLVLSVAYFVSRRRADLNPGK